MSDYTELCRELRNTERICRDRMDGEVMLKAADAIEELLASVEGYKASTDVQFIEHGHYTEMKFIPKWIPVTEQPKPGQYLIHKLYDHGYGEYHSYDILTFTDNLNKVDKYDFHGKEYKRPGWFDYDSEYGHFECGDNITHYMPLPEPPKEETE